MSTTGLILLTGFLGAGKTTLLGNILDGFAEEKVGVIVNEFSDTGVDGTLLARDGVKMAELTNGSIFCACIKANFLNGLVEMSRQDISYLFIEASGLADPSEMPRILEAVAPSTYRAFVYKGAICVVDPETFPELSEVLPALVRQAEYCSIAVINKADLADENRISLTARIISEINPGCEIIVTSFCRLDTRALTDRLAPAGKAALESTNTVESRPKSVVLKAHDEIPIDGLRKFIDSLSPHTYRIKGFLPTDQGTVSVNAVGAQVGVTAWVGDTPAYRLVVISSVGISIISRITRALTDAQLKGKLSL